MRFLLLFVVAFTLGCNDGRHYRMPSISMQPTIVMKAKIEVDTDYYHSRPVQRFDIVVVEDPDGKKKKYVKRIVGLGGETLSIRNGKVYVNSAELSEPFENIPATEDFGPIKIPGGQFFLLGDNRSASWDSRYWQNKTVGTDLIYGKVIKIGN